MDKEWKDEVNVSGFNDLHVESIISNFKMIDSLYSDIKIMDSEDSSQYFKNVLKTLENLRNLAEKFSNNGRIISGHDRDLYRQYGTKVLESIDDYLEKTDMKARPAIENQLNAVINLKKRVSANLMGLTSALDSVRADIEKMALGDKMQVIDRYAVITYQHRNHFLGDHKLEELNGSIFSLGRSAGYSISVFALLNRGYSINDIMDSTKLHKEKREMFRKFIRFIS